MTDMLVKLYEKLPKNEVTYNADKVKIKRALAIDTQVIVNFVDEHFREICPGWVDECRATLYRHPTTCFIATYENQVIGFACYDGTAKGMVGPVGVAESFRKQGIATELLKHCFEAMKMDGYVYAVIGWVSSESFYEKTCNAIAIGGSFPGVYSRMVVDHV